MENDDPFLERKFLVDGNEMTCRFYRPVSDGQDYSCRYEIAWPDSLRSRSAWGVDSVQALSLAMQAMHSDLLLRREREGIDVRWLDGRDLGLPPIGEDTAASRD